MKPIEHALIFLKNQVPQKCSQEWCKNPVEPGTDMCMACNDDVSESWSRQHGGDRI